MEIPDFLPADGLEWRRFQALRLKQHGWLRHDIAEALGVAPETVSRWLARVRDGGPEAPHARPRPRPAPPPPRRARASARRIPRAGELGVGRGGGGGGGGGGGVRGRRRGGRGRRRGMGGVRQQGPRRRSPQGAARGGRPALVPPVTG